MAPNSGAKNYRRDNVMLPTVPRVDYSKIAKYYNKVRHRPTDIWPSRIIEYGGISANSVVLDVGCGTGRFPLSIWTAKKCTVCGLDPSDKMLKQALVKDTARNLLWICGDGRRLPFRDESFDCVYMTLVIHHLESKELLYREIRRVLKEKLRDHDSFAFSNQETCREQVHLNLDIVQRRSISKRLRDFSAESVEKAWRASKTGL